MYRSAIFAPIGQAAVEPRYGRFSIFQDGDRPPSRICKSEILNARKSLKANVHHHVKFRINRSHRCPYMAVFICLNGNRPPCSIFKILNFVYHESQCALPCQISCRSLKPLPRYGRLFSFQDGGRSPSWIFKSIELKVGNVNCLTVNIRRAYKRH